MKKLSLVIAASLLFLGALASAEQIKDIAKLNRLSQTLRGHGLAEIERKDFASAANRGEVEEFLKRKTDEYLASSQHAFKMRVRLEELFRLKSPHMGGTESQNIIPFDFKYSNENALSHLFSDLARRNLSWDELLTAKTYTLYNSERFESFPGFGVNDFGFMAALVPDLKSFSGAYSSDRSPLKTTEVRFEPQDQRIAGALTTSRFMTRYVNTGLNKNRKRAAEVFRVFLCDSMAAAIPSTEGKDDLILDLMLPHDQGMTENEIRTMAQQGDALHGDRPDCNACHFKLDPVGRTFLTSPFVLSPVASPGALSFKRGQTVVKIPVKGVGGLGAAIVNQPEYVSCQIDHFWSWFMGPRQKLTAAKKAQLTTEFERVGRKTNDFIKVILAQPEFFEFNQPMSENEIRALQVKSYLKKCQDCHKDSYNSNSDDGSFPDFTQWPIGGNANEMKTWIRKISRAMDLAHDGESPMMPPKSAPWRTSLREVNLMKKWIADGTPDEAGRKMVEP